MHDGAAPSRRRTPITVTASAPTADGAAERAPRAGISHPIGPLGTLWQVVAGWSFTFAYAIFVITLSVLTLGRLSNHMTVPLLRVWSRVMLLIQRVELVVEGTEHIRERQMRVLVFNHTSLLDAMIVTATQPAGGVPAIKREVLYIPFVGVALWAMGFLLIDRGRTDRAKRILARAAARMARERLSVIIAPEGTRSPDGHLQPFKKGAFHLARVSRAPVTLMLIDGAAELQPKGAPVSHPGRVRVRFLPPIATDDLTLDGLGPFSERVRAAMLDGLDDLRR